MAERLAADLRAAHPSVRAALDKSLQTELPCEPKARDTGTLGKIMDVIDAVAFSEEPPRFTDLLNRLEQPRGTLHRNLANLLEEQIIVLNQQTHAYQHAKDFHVFSLLCNGVGIAVSPRQSGPRFTPLETTGVS